MTTDAQILKILRQASTEGVNSPELETQLGISRAALSARIEALRALGYVIEASPHRGYQLVTEPDLLNADTLNSRLVRTRIIGRDIRVFQETGSTNDVIEKLARDGLDEGVVVFAESQTRGRGRLGRQWVSPPKKGLWFSLLLRPPMGLREITQLTVAAATALRRAIHSQTGLAVVIKWPNDICFKNKKLSGILTELHAELDRVQFVVLGIGVDVNLGTDDFPADLRAIATALQAELGQPVPRADLAVAILTALDEDYAKIRAGDFAKVAEEWEEHCTTLGQHVIIQVGSRQVRGRAESLGEDGALLVRTEHGHLERIIGGDVSIEKPESRTRG